MKVSLPTKKTLTPTTNQSSRKDQTVEFCSEDSLDKRDGFRLFSPRNLKAKTIDLGWPRGLVVSTRVSLQSIQVHIISSTYRRTSLIRPPPPDLRKQFRMESPAIEIVQMDLFPTSSVAAMWKCLSPVNKSPPPTNKSFTTVTKGLSPERHQASRAKFSVQKCAAVPRRARI